MAPENKASGVSSVSVAQDSLRITTTPLNDRDRRDSFAAQMGAAILFRGQGRTPLSLAREVIPFVDAFLAQLDAPSK